MCVVLHSQSCGKRDIALASSPDCSLQYVANQWSLWHWAKHLMFGPFISYSGKPVANRVEWVGKGNWCRLHGCLVFCCGCISKLWVTLLNNDCGNRWLSLTMTVAIREICYMLLRLSMELSEIECKSVVCGTWSFFTCYTDRCAMNKLRRYRVLLGATEWVVTLHCRLYAI